MPNQKTSYQFKYRNYAEALYEALREDPFYITLERGVPDTQSPKQAMLRYLDYSMAESEKYGELFIPNEHAYGVSVWSKPLEPKLKAKKAQEKKSFLLKNMGQQSSSLYTAIVEFMSEKSQPLVKDSFWYLSIVGVLPEFQGMGLGSALVKRELEKLDMAGVATYLETFTSTNMTFYERLGYQAADTFHEPTTQAQYWLMVRDCSHA